MHHFFCYLGVFAQNVPFIKRNSSYERIFLRPILTCANTPNRFYGFISNFSNICFPYLYLFGNWGVEGAMCKILELCDQNPRRNNWSKLGTFDSILQRPHSAMLEDNTALHFSMIHNFQKRHLEGGALTP